MTIALGQVGKLLRLETEGEGFFVELFDLITQLRDLHVPTLVLGSACLVALYVLERWIPRIPAALIVVIGSIAAVSILDLESTGVLVAGEIPAGLPSLALPSMDWSVVVGLIPGAIGVAIVVYGETMALSRTFSARHGERVDADQELLALGAANFAGGLFGSFVTNGSSSRSAAADAAGQRTQVASLIVVSLMIATLLFMTEWFADLPEAALGAIVVHAVVGLIRFEPITSLRQRNAVDFWAAVATLMGVLVLDVLAGLIIGVLVSIAGLMRRAVRPRIGWMARDTVTGSFVPRQLPSAEEVDRISIVHVGAELFFANVTPFREAVTQEVASRAPYAVVVDAAAVSDIDTTAGDQIVDLADELGGMGTQLTFVRLAPEARRALRDSGLEFEGIEFRRIDEAVAALTVRMDEGE